MKRQGTSSAVEFGLAPAEYGEEPIYRFETSLNLNGAQVYTTTVSHDWELTGLYVHFSAASTSTVSITLDAAGGANYDTLIYSKTLAANTDFAYVPEGGEMEFEDGDEIKLNISIDAGKIAYVTILYKLR